MLRTLLGLQADAPGGRLYVQPTLPRWLPGVTLSNLRCGDARLALRFWRAGDTSRWEVTDKQGEIEVVEGAAPFEEIK
jgi:hypothetical protein